MHLLLTKPHAEWRAPIRMGRQDRPWTQHCEGFPTQCWPGAALLGAKSWARVCRTGTCACATCRGGHPPTPVSGARVRVHPSTRPHRPHNTSQDQFGPSTQGGALEFEAVAPKLAHPLTHHHNTAAAPQKHDVCTQYTAWGPVATTLVLQCRPTPSHKALGTPPSPTPRTNLTLTQTPGSGTLLFFESGPCDFMPTTARPVYKSI